MVRKEPGCIPEFGGQLRSEAAARFSEPRFRSCHAGEHTLQPLRTQHQEPEREDEENTCAKPNLTLGLHFACWQDVRVCAIRRLMLFDGRLESANPLADSFAEFRKLLGSKDK